MPSLEKRDDGGWSILYRKPDGSPSRVSINRLVGRRVTEKAEAEAIYHRWLVKNLRTDYSPPDRHALTDLFRRYDAYANARWTAESYRVDMPRLADFLSFAQEQGAIYADQVTPILIEDYRAALMARGMAPQTANKYLERVRAFFNRLHGWRLIERSPVERLEMQKTHRPEMRILTDEEIRRLWVVLGDPDLEDVVTVALQTGMRQAEICRLRFADCQPDGIHVLKTKSYRPRTIPYAPGVQETVERRRDQRPGQSYVFANGRGEPVPGNVWYQKLVGAYMRAGIEGANFHSLRHTFASRLLRAGANIVVVQTLMGHQDIKTTLRYVHLYADDASRAVAGLGLP